MNQIKKIALYSALIGNLAFGGTALAQDHKINETQVVQYILDHTATKKLLIDEKSDDNKVYGFSVYRDSNELKKMYSSDVLFNAQFDKAYAYPTLEAALKSQEADLCRAYEKRGYKTAIHEIDLTTRDFTNLFNGDGKKIADLKGNYRFNSTE